MNADEARKALIEPATYTALGFGHECVACGSVVVDQERHRRWHEAVAVATRRPKSGARS